MASDSSILTVHDITQVLKNGDERVQVESVRLLDHYAATSIASYACIRMTDQNGNPSEAYWKCFVLDPSKQCGLLLNVATVEKVMVDLMNKMIEKHQEALLQINDDVAVCNLEQQRRFFRAHIQTWVEQLCDTVVAHPRAQVWRALAVFTQQFVRVETQGFDMLEA
jgi:hypothetical protein